MQLAPEMLKDHSHEYHTLQSVYCPCLKLVQCDLCCGRQYVEVESVFIVLLLEFCFGKLSFLVVEVCASLGVNSGMVVADHGFVVDVLSCCCFRDFGDAEC